MNSFDNQSSRSPETSFDEISSRAPAVDPTPSSPHQCLAGDCAQSGRHVFMHRSWRSLAHWIALFIAFGIFTVYISRTIPGTIFVLEIPFFGFNLGVYLPLFVLPCALLLVRPIFLMYDARDEIRCHHVLSMDGICSLRKNTSAYAYENLLGVHVRQTLWERIMGVGTIEAGTAMTDKAEIQVEGIANPMKYAKIITEKIDEARMQSPHYRPPSMPR